MVDAAYRLWGSSFAGCGQSMSTDTDDRLGNLLRATAHGDAMAFKALYDRSAPRLHAVALTMMRDSELAEDVLQDAFVQIWHRAGDYHADRGSVLAWMTTIVRYRGIDLLRRRRQASQAAGSGQVSIDPAAMDNIREGGTGSELGSGQPGPLARAMSSEVNSLLRDCIKRLSSKQRHSIALAFFRGLTHQELADALAEPIGTIKSRLRRSLKRLKECLEPLDADNAIHARTD